MNAKINRQGTFKNKNNVWGDPSVREVWGNTNSAWRGRSSWLLAPGTKSSSPRSSAPPARCIASPHTWTDPCRISPPFRSSTSFQPEGIFQQDDGDWSALLQRKKACSVDAPQSEECTGVHVDSSDLSTLFLHYFFYSIGDNSRSKGRQNKTPQLYHSPTSKVQNNPLKLKGKN